MPTHENDRSRLFVALPLPSSLKSALAQLTAEWRQADIAPFSRWVHAEDYHVTLKFLGATTPEQLRGIREQLTAVAAAAAPFPLALSGVGTFGRPAAPSILWAGVRGALEPLTALQRAVEAALGPLGFPAEERPYSPHVTLARKYAGSGPFAPPPTIGPLGLSSAPGEPPGLPWTADRIVLYHSQLGRLPMYEAAAQFPLPSAKS